LILFYKNSIIDLVIEMDLFQNIFITDIQKPLVVNSYKGRVYHVTDRYCYALSFCISGRITYTMAGQKYVSDPQNAILLPQGGTYSLYGDKEGAFPVINFSCQNFECNQILVLPLQNSQTYIRDFETLKSLFLHDGNRLKIFSLFYEMLDKLEKDQHPFQNHLNPAIAYLEMHISDPALSNTLLADMLGISEVYLRKLFLAQYNTTPRQYLLNLRIQKARQLLSDTMLTVTDISEKCGFSSVYHFCRTFKGRTGVTPTEYASQNRTFRI